MRAGFYMALALVFAPVTSLLAQDDSLSRLQAGGSTGAPAIVEARATTGPIRLDGRADEPAWATADSISDFRQREPSVGAPATEPTVVKMLRDGEALYVSVRAYDSSPAAIRAAQLRRDAELGSDDNVSLIIDSFNDRRGAFLFQTNANGAMRDAQITVSENTNTNWNGIWEVAASRDSLGWSAEFRIPFGTLRFRPGSSAVGFNVARFIRRKNEETLWRSYGRTQGLQNLLYAGQLTGFGGVLRGRDVELRPYVLGRLIERSYDAAGARSGNASMGGKVGLDAKIALAPSITGDFTVNTDFAQVEADRQVVNLSRFPLFFPEKRQFFLESSGLFDFGAPGEIQPFYSRRIGLRDGVPVPILGGARIYGKSGPWAFGALDARTGDGENANDAVVRVKRDLFARSYIGAIVTQRSGPGVAGAERAAGLDASFPLVVRGRNVQPFAWVTGTSTPDSRAVSSATPMAWRVGLEYPNDLLRGFLALYSVDSAFSPTLGFVRRTGIWGSTGYIAYRPRPGVLGIRQLDLKLIPSWSVLADRKGSLTSAADWQTASFEWRFLGGELQSGDRFEVNLQRRMDAPVETFEIFRGVNVAPGRYWWTRGELQYETSAGRPLSFGSRVSWGNFYDGRNTELSLAGTWRGGGHVIMGADITRNDARLSAGRFTALQTSGRVEYSLNTRVTFLSFVQYNNEARRADFNLRFHWIPKIGDDVFVVWNSGYTTDPSAPFRFPARNSLARPLNGALVFKVVHRLAL